jgi:hypothetical protein
MNFVFRAGLCLLAGITLFTASCKKNDGARLPNISLKTGTGYTAIDTTVAKNTDLLIGINASKAVDDDPLTFFALTRSYDDATPDTVYSGTLNSVEGQSLTKDYSTAARNQAGSERYTFSVTSSAGLTNSVSVNVTVQ